MHTFAVEFTGAIRNCAISGGLISLSLNLYAAHVASLRQAYFVPSFVSSFDIRSINPFSLWVSSPSRLVLALTVETTPALTHLEIG